MFSTSPEMEERPVPCDHPNRDSANRAAAGTAPRRDGASPRAPAREYSSPGFHGAFIVLSRPGLIVALA